MKRLSDILKEAMTPGFEKAFASTPKGVEVHMKHKETGKIVKTKFLGTHSAVAAAKKHINDMQGKGYTVHAKKLIEEVEQLGELKTSTLLSYHSKSQKSAAELGNEASKEMDAGNMKKASALLKKVSKRQKSQSQAMGKIQKRYANLKDEVEHTDEELQESLLEILREMAKRGRPKKNPTAPAPSKMSKDDDEEENEEPDTGPEADKNITVQLKKAADQAVHGEKGGADIEFADGKKHFVHGHVAHKVLNAMEKMKPAQRAEAQKGIHQSHAHLMAVHKMLSR